ncbi:magnesium and cobalt transport protein CorA, partial [Anaplasma phagocytophilum]
MGNFPIYKEGKYARKTGRCFTIIDAITRPAMSYHLLDKKTSDFLIDAIEEERAGDIREILDNVDGVQLASFLLTSTINQRKGLLKYVGDELVSDTLVHLVPGLRQEAVSTLGVSKVAALIA